MRKAFFFSAGSLCVVLALVGIFLPVLPTTPFLLLAAYLFTRSSERALGWLLNNRWFGSYLRNYREGRGMALQDKVITLLALWLTIGATILFVLDNLWLRLLLSGVAAGVTAHLLRVKTYRAEPAPVAGEPAAEAD